MSSDRQLREMTSNPRSRKILVTDGNTTVGEAIVRALVNAGGLGNHLGVKRRAGRRDHLRRDPRRDPADHLHRHGDAFPD